jgi:protein disulfide-isomerase
MKREVFADNEVMEVINSEVIPVMIDIDNPNTKELVKHYNIGATPTTVIVDSQGNVIDYAVGKIEKKNFLEILNNLNTNKQ